MNTEPRTLVVIATYNEIDNLPRLTDEVLQHAPQSHVLVIDDGSPDGTGQWCDERAAQDDRFHVIHRGTSPRSWPAWRGMRAATEPT